MILEVGENVSVNISSFLSVKVSFLQEEEEERGRYSIRFFMFIYHSKLSKMGW